MAWCMHLGETVASGVARDTTRRAIIVRRVFSEQASRQADRQTGKQAERQADRQACRMLNSQDGQEGTRGTDSQSLSGAVNHCQSLSVWTGAVRIASQSDLVGLVGRSAWLEQSVQQGQPEWPE